MLFPRSDKFLAVKKSKPRHGLGWAIRKIRKGQGRTLEDVAAEIRSDAANLSRMERGTQEITEPTLLRIAAAFGVRVSEIWQLAESVDHDSDDSGRLLALSALLTKEQRASLLEFGIYLKERRPG